MNRRTFLSAAAMASAAAVPALAAQHKMKMHLSCGSLGIKANQREAIEYARRFGFDVVDADSAFLASLSDDELRRLLDEMKAAKVGWGTSGLPLEFRKDDAAFAESLKAFPARAKALQRAGVERVTTWISPTSNDLTYVQNFRTHAQRLREAAKILNDHGLRFGLEYVGPKTSWTARRYPFIHSMAEMKDLLAEIGQPNMGFVLDSWHWYTAGETKADLLTLTNRDVVSVDLNDAPAGIPVDQQMDLKRELPAATGVIDVKAFLSALVEIGCDAPVRAEPFNEPLRQMPPDKALETTIAALKKAFGQLS